MKHIFQRLTLIIFVVIIGIFDVNAQKKEGLEIGMIIPDQCEPPIPIQSEPLFRTKVNHLLK
jgi:hypothetical protein